MAVDQAEASIRLVAMSTGMMSAVPRMSPCMVRSMPLPICVSVKVSLLIVVS